MRIMWGLFDWDSQEFIEFREQPERDCYGEPLPGWLIVEVSA